MTTEYVVIQTSKGPDWLKIEDGKITVKDGSGQDVVVAVDGSTPGWGLDEGRAYLQKMLRMTSHGGLEWQEAGREVSESFVKSVCPALDVMRVAALKFARGRSDWQYLTQSTYAQLVAYEYSLMSPQQKADLKAKADAKAVRDAQQACRTLGINPQKLSDMSLGQIEEAGNAEDKRGLKDIKLIGAAQDLRALRSMETAGYVSLAALRPSLPTSAPGIPVSKKATSKLPTNETSPRNRLREIVSSTLSFIRLKRAAGISAGPTAAQKGPTAAQKKALVAGVRTAFVR